MNAWLKLKIAQKMKFTKQNSVIVNASMKITHRRVPRDLRMYLFCLSQLVSYLHLTISIVDILALCFKQGPYVSNKGSSTPLFVSYGIYIWSVKKPREFGTLIRKQLKKDAFLTILLRNMVSTARETTSWATGRLGI